MKKVPKRRRAAIDLPRGVHCTVSRGHEYFYYHPGRGTAHEGPRTKLPNDPHAPEFWEAFAKASGESIRTPVRKLAKAVEPKGFVYFLRCGDAIKIGFSTKPFHRVRNLQTGMPARPSFALFVTGTRDDEHRIHTQLRQARLTGEWFAADPIVTRRIGHIAATSNITDPGNCHPKKQAARRNRAAFFDSRRRAPGQVQ